MMMTERIKKRRKEMGLTQQELADQLNISSKTVSRWESGAQLPDVALVPEIARVLGITVNELYGMNECGESTDNHSSKSITKHANDHIRDEHTANRTVIRVYRSISIVAVVVSLLGGIWLCVYDALRVSLADESGNVRSIGYIFFCGGVIGLLGNQIWFTLFRCKYDKDNDVYLTSEFKTGGAVFLLLFAMAGVMMPFWIGFPFSEAYATVCFSAVIIVQWRMLVCYSHFSKRGMILKRWIPITTSAVMLTAVSAYASWMLHGALTALWAQDDGTLAYYSADRMQIVANITDMTHRFNYYGMLCTSVVLLIMLIITYMYLVKRINDGENK